VHHHHPRLYRMLVQHLMWFTPERPPPKPLPQAAPPSLRLPALARKLQSSVHAQKRLRARALEAVMKKKWRMLLPTPLPHTGAPLVTGSCAKLVFAIPLQIPFCEKCREQGIGC